MRWIEGQGVSVYRAPSHFANGQTRDRQGRLIACSHRGRCLYRTEYDGHVTTIVDRHAGKRLNSPNDVVVKSDGSIWFTDPLYGIANDYEGGRQASEQPPQSTGLNRNRATYESSRTISTAPTGWHDYT
jgi:gluconolactonase